MIFGNSWPVLADGGLDIRNKQAVQAKVLITTIDRLETEKESLINMVSDLRQLLQRVALQQEREAQRRKAHTNELDLEVLRLKTALLVSEKHSKHLKAMSDFWVEILE
jgi:hypothetical protein